MENKTILWRVPLESLKKLLESLKKWTKVEIKEEIDWEQNVARNNVSQSPRENFPEMIG